MRSLSLIALLACGCTDSSPAPSGTDGGPDALGGDASMPGDGGGCADVLGAYAITKTVGMGCGDLAVAAPECLLGLAGAGCSGHFVSTPDGGTGAINGGITLAPDGSFSGAALILGTVQRTGCTGTWDAATSTMVVNCGGMGGSQECTITLTRTQPGMCR
jgi:hypothetical protein